MTDRDLELALYSVLSSKSLSVIVQNLSAVTRIAWFGLSQITDYYSKGELSTEYKFSLLSVNNNWQQKLACNYVRGLEMALNSGDM